MKVLIVCSGNICRSPMAEGYLRARGGRAAFEVQSAGTLGIEGEPPSPEAIQVMQEIGVDISTHRSRSLSATALRQNDLVLVMTRMHLQELAERYPVEGGTARRLLLEWEDLTLPSDQAPDLTDPIGRPIEFYRRVRSRICRAVDNLVAAAEL